MINDIRAIIALWFMEMAFRIAPRDGMKQNVAKALVAISLGEWGRNNA